MSIAIWVAIAIPIVFTLAPVTQGVKRKVNTKELNKLTTTTGLPLPAELGGPVLERIATRERFAVIGGMVGVAVAVLGTVFAGVDDTVGGIAVMTLAPLGGYVGALAAVLWGRTTVDENAPRMARGEEATAADYARPTERALRRIAPAIAVVVAVSTAAVGLLLPGPADDGLWAGLPAVVAAVAVLVGAGAELVSRAVAGRPQRANTRLELAWDDVLRAEAMRGITTSVLMLSAISVAVSGFGLAAATIDPDVRAGAMELTLVLGFVAGGITLLGLAALAVFGFIALQHKANAWVLDRLWSGEDFVVEARGRA